MKFKILFTILSNLIFWGWNVTFLLFIYTGFLPILGGILILETVRGTIPFDFFLTIVGLIVVPTVCTFLGGKHFAAKSPELMRLFYGVEAPLFLLLILRLFLIRELTPATTYFLGSFFLSIAAFAVEIVLGYVGKSERFSLNSQQRVLFSGLQMAAHSLMIIVGINVGAVLLFYAIPIGWWLILGFISFAWLKALGDVFLYSGVGAVWYLLIFLISFGITASLFVAMPVSFAWLYVRSGIRIVQNFSNQFGTLKAAAGMIAVVVLWSGIFMQLQQQPQLEAFEILSRPIQTEQAKQEILGKSEVIRKGLLNAYLSSYRYLSTDVENNHIKEIYRGSFGLSDTDAQTVQNVYNLLMSPFLYKGDSQDDQKAEELYAQFFDVPIQRSQREAITHAVRSTYNQEEAKAGLLNINQQYVWLESQTLTVSPKGDWDQIEIHEVYANQTTEQQEVFYYFSLPESAVVTGVWLGESEDRAKRFVYTVSPRGAAQQVYNEQVQVRRDPALLEQVGPRHYRLRVFPIPPKTTFSRWETTPVQPSPKMHLWVTYQALRQDGETPLPQLAEQRNIYWTNATQRILNGKRQKGDERTWMPYLLKSVPTPPQAYRVNVSAQEQVVLQPMANQGFRLPQNQRFAVIVDTSRSMEKHQKALQEAINWLKGGEFQGNAIDLYLTAPKGGKPQRLENWQNNPQSWKAEKAVFYGSLQLKEMLRQFGFLRGEARYDGILLITDEGSYELADDSERVPDLQAPLWLIHLNGKFPLAYDDATLKAMQDSRGGVAADAVEALKRMATQQAMGNQVINVVDGYAFRREPKGTTPATPSQLQPIAARQLIMAWSREKTGEKLTQLDAMHAIAKEYSIVTPYSSMIVLVNDEQRESLRRAELKKDRFDREVETGKEQLTKPFNPLSQSTVSGVPEPAEWLLIGAGVILLVVMIRRRSQALT